MLMTAHEIPEWWPKRVHTWANHTFAHYCESGLQEKELVLLLTDKRMEAAKKILTTRPKRAKRGTPQIPDHDWVPPAYLDCFDDQLIGFLTHAWQARGIWRNWHNRRPDNRKAELGELKIACDSLLVHLEREKFAATWALELPESNGRSISTGQARYQSLREMLRSISVTIAHSGKWLESGLPGQSEEEVSKLPRAAHPKHYAPYDVERAEEIFVVRYLSENAQKLFGRLQHEPVAIATRVLFDLADDREENEKYVGRVMELWKERPR